MAIVNSLLSTFNNGNKDTKYIDNLDNSEYLDKIIEYKAWYVGNPNVLQYFYKITCGQSNKYFYNIDIAENTFFWAKVKNNNIKRHVPLASSICEAMSDLLFSNGINIINEEYQELIDEVIEFNNIESLYTKGAEDESWGGHIAYKLIYDKEFNATPIIQGYSVDEFTVCKKYGKTIQIVFHDYFIEDKKQYKLNEIYGRGFIDYELFEKDKKGCYELVSLLETEKTRELERVEFLINDELIDVIFAVEKPNKSPNPENEIYGRSDYAGLETEFDGLDEAENAIGDLVRRGKLKRYATVDNITVDTNGNRIEVSNENNDYEIFADGGKDDAAPTIVMQEPTLGAIDKLEKAKQQKQVDILTRVKISPSTLGIDLAGANASGASVREREKASLRTRNAKIKVWIPFLQDFYNKIILLNEFVNKKLFIDNNGFLPYYEIGVDFNDYVIPTLEERVETMGKALANKTSDIQTAVSQVWIGKTEEEIEEIIKNIKLENDILAIDIDEEIEESEEIEEIEDDE